MTEITKEQEEVLTQAQLALQCFDKGQLTEKEVGSITGIHLQTGEPTKDWDKLCLHQILMQLSDKTLVTEDVVRKCLFNLPPKNN